MRRDHKTYSPKDIVKAFWLKVDRRGADECWFWKGAQDGSGYGHLKTHGRMIQAHRMAYILVNGPLDTKQRICHSCDVRLCCNPFHLWPGTAKQNSLDASRKGRMSHKYTVEDVQKVKRLLASGVPVEEIARRLCMGRDAVRKISKGRTWAYV